MKKQFRHLFSAMIVASMVILAIGSDESDNSSSSGSNSSTSSGSSNNKQQDNKCPRCNGSGSVSTYSAATCTMSHFESGDCYGGHKSGYDCIPTGSKTCPCCNGSGKSTNK